MSVQKVEKRDDVVVVNEIEKKKKKKKKKKIKCAYLEPKFIVSEIWTLIS